MGNLVAGVQVMDSDSESERESSQDPSESERESLESESEELIAAGARPREDGAQNARGDRTAFWRHRLGTPMSDDAPGPPAAGILRGRPRPRFLEGQLEVL